LTDPKLLSLSATDAAQAIARGTFSAQDYMRACLDRIAAVEPEIQAFAFLDPEHAMSEARARDEHRLNGRPLGPLHGIPVAVKDIVDTADQPTAFGSALFAGRQPMQDATVARRLREAGAIIIGKTVTTEFAYFHPGKTRNPHDTQRTPGGSSSGSAAAVAAGMVPLAIGSQTNGSVIRPASFCGVYGMKPSRGRVSRHGVLPLSPTLDVVGPFARSVSDIALALDVIAGHDENDRDSIAYAPPNFRAVAGEDFPIAPRFALVRTPVWDKADAETQVAFERLAESLGDACIRIDLPEHLAQAWVTHRAIMATEMAYNLSGAVARGGEAISKVLRDLVTEGCGVAAVRYLEALDDARSVARTLAAMFEDCNAVITPASRGIAPMGLDGTGDPVFCTLWTLAGLPSLSLPLLAGTDDMPIGVQLVGGPQEDARLLRSAQWLVNRLTPSKSKGRKRAVKG
jgi:Asp-tRNA(Asn)/Glu-tRNA(Gln) amidotransferase A subunit family amidase